MEKLGSYPNVKYTHLSKSAEHAQLFVPKRTSDRSTVCRKVSSPYWKSPVTPVTYMAFKALMCHDPPASAALSQCLRTQTVCPMACTCKWKTQMGKSQHIYIYIYIYIYMHMYMYMYVYMFFVFVSVYVYVNVQMYICIYIYI